MMDPRRTPAAAVLGAVVRQERAGQGGVCAAVNEVLRALGRLKRVAREQGADVRSIGLVRCAQDAVQAVGDRYRFGVFKSKSLPLSATDGQARADGRD